jgi:hypothetical protein
VVYSVCSPDCQSVVVIPQRSFTKAATMWLGSFVTAIRCGLSESAIADWEQQSGCTSLRNTAGGSLIVSRVISPNVPNVAGQGGCQRGGSQGWLYPFRRLIADCGDCALFVKASCSSSYSHRLVRHLDAATAVPDIVQANRTKL